MMDHKATGRAWQLMEDGDRMAHFGRTLRERGAKATARAIAAALRALGHPRPGEGALRIVAHLKTGAELSRGNGKGGSGMADMARVKAAAQVLRLMPQEQRRAAFEARRREVGDQQFAAEAVAIGAALAGKDLTAAPSAHLRADMAAVARHPGDAGLLRDVAGQMPQRADAPAGQDAEYQQVLALSGAAHPDARYPNARR